MKNKRWSRRGARIIRYCGLALLFILLLGGCAVLRDEQPKVDPFEPNDFFEHSQSARPIAEDTVPQEAEPQLGWVETGMLDGEPVVSMPVTVTVDLLARGEEQYNVYCSPCHGLTGNGRGVVVNHGFPEPPSFHSDRLRGVPDAHFFDVITNGFGHMYDYAAQVQPADRWAVIAYIRVLQMSQHTPLEQLTPEEIEALEEME